MNPQVAVVDPCALMRKYVSLDLRTEGLSVTYVSPHSNLLPFRWKCLSYSMPFQRDISNGSLAWSTDGKFPAKELDGGVHFEYVFHGAVYFTVNRWTPRNDFMLRLRRSSRNKGPWTRITSIGFGLGGIQAWFPVLSLPCSVRELHNFIRSQFANWENGSSAYFPRVSEV